MYKRPMIQGVWTFKKKLVLLHKYEFYLMLLATKHLKKNKKYAVHTRSRVITFHKRNGTKSNEINPGRMDRALQLQDPQDITSVLLYVIHSCMKSAMLPQPPKLVGFTVSVKCPKFWQSSLVSARPRVFICRYNRSCLVVTALDQQSTCRLMRLLQATGRNVHSCFSVGAPWTRVLAQMKFRLVFFPPAF